MRKSRACMCSSGLAIVFGIVLAAAGVGILVAIAYEQHDTDLWLILSLLIGAGLGIVLMGLVCCGCSALCFSSSNSVGILDDEEELTKSTITPNEEE